MDLLKLPIRPAFGITQAFTTGNDIPYAACFSAAKSAVGLTQATNEANQMQGSMIEIVFPGVVIDGLLFQSYLSEGEVIVEEVQSGTLVWRNPIVGMPHTIMHIITLPYVKTFANQAQLAADKFLSAELEIEQFLKDQGIWWTVSGSPRRNLGKES